LITIPYLTLAWTIQLREVKVYDRTGKGNGNRGTEGDNRKWIGLRRRQPPRQINRLNIAQLHVARWFLDPLSSAQGW